MSKTEQNLMNAFAGESQANRKYLAFAKKAEEEGYAQVAKLFRAAAASETIHAHNHLRALGAVKSTKDNLLAAIGGETYEFQKMYPPMIADAKEDGNDKAFMSFLGANEVEKIHAALYQRALDSLGTNVVADYYVCSSCGYTAEGGAPDECPVCKAKKRAFHRAE
jgi:rubrerythrin